jgi:hypothetical protein
MSKALIPEILRIPEAKIDFSLGITTITRDFNVKSLNPGNPEES